MPGTTATTNAARFLVVALAAGESELLLRAPFGHGNPLGATHAGVKQSAADAAHTLAQPLAQPLALTRTLGGRCGAA